MHWTRDTSISERLELHKLVRSMVPKYKVPSFRTFNISRTYSLKVKLILEDAMEKYGPEFTAPEFTIFSQAWLSHEVVDGSKPQLTAELSISGKMEAPAFPALRELPTFEEFVGEKSVTGPSDWHEPFSPYGQGHPPVALEGSVGEC